MNEMTTKQTILAFSFEQGPPIRGALHEDGASWFLAKDLSEALGYEQTANGLKHCKHSTCLDELNKINGLAPASKWIPESDVYRMVLNSTLPAAERFT